MRELRDSDVAIRIGERPKSKAWKNRAGMILIIFMRVVAAIWILQGLLHWARLIAPGLPLFNTMPMAAAVLVIIFGVLDLIAAIGMWLIAPWGGVLWLLAGATQMFVAIAIPNFFPAGRAVAIFDLSLIVAYFVLTWQASREDGHRLLSSHLFRR